MILFQYSIPFLFQVYFYNNDEPEKKEVIKMTLGGLLLIALIVATISICRKLKEHSRRIKELEGGTK